MDITDNTSNISCSCHALTQNSTVWGSTLLYADNKPQIGDQNDDICSETKC